MRRAERRIKEIEQQLEILDECKVIRLAMVDETGLYIVPLNYGYSYQDEKFTFFVHSAPEGRKVRALKSGNQIGFEMDCRHAPIEGDIACNYGYSYASIIGTGTPVFLDDPKEKAAGLRVLMKHQTGRPFEISEQMTQGTAVFRIDVDGLSAKTNISK